MRKTSEHLLDVFFQVDFNYDPGMDRAIRNQLLGREAEIETGDTWYPRGVGEVVILQSSTHIGCNSSTG